MAEQRTDFVAYVDQHIQSIADLEHLIQQGANDPLFVANVFKSGSWELFDKVYAMSDDYSITAGQQSILLEVASHISTHVRPREVLLMVLEKISGCSGLFPFQLVLHTMQLTIAKGNSLDVWQQGTLYFSTLIFSTSIDKELMSVYHRIGCDCPKGSWPH